MDFAESGFSNDVAWSKIVPGGNTSFLPLLDKEEVEPHEFLKMLSITLSGLKGYHTKAHPMDLIVKGVWK